MKSENSPNCNRKSNRSTDKKTICYLPTLFKARDEKEQARWGEGGAGGGKYPPNSNIFLEQVSIKPLFFSACHKQKAQKPSSLYSDFLYWETEMSCDI